MKKVVFISVPMSGRDEKDILKDIEDAKRLYLDRTGMGIHDVAFNNNYATGRIGLDFKRKDAEDHGTIWIPPKNERLWLTGGALKWLSYCDEAVFYGDWQNSKGCTVEKAACDAYGITTIIE